MEALSKGEGRKGGKWVAMMKERRDEAKVEWTCVNSEAQGVYQFDIGYDSHTCRLPSPLTSPPPPASPAHQVSLTASRVREATLNPSFLSAPPRPVCLLFLFVGQTYHEFSLPTFHLLVFTFALFQVVSIKM